MAEPQLFFGNTIQCYQLTLPVLQRKRNDLFFSANQTKLSIMNIEERKEFSFKHAITATDSDTYSPTSVYLDITSKDADVSKPDMGKNQNHWEEEEKRRWRNLFVIGSIIVYAARVSMSISIAAIGKELDWNKQTSGMAMSAFFYGYLVTNVLGGYLADRIGGSIVIFYTSFGWVVLTMMLPYFSHMESMFFSQTSAVLFARFLTGLCQGVFYPSFSSIVSTHIAVAKRGFFFGLVTAGNAIGTCGTGFFGSMIVEQGTWEYLFILVGLLGLLWIAWLRCVMSMSTKDIYRKSFDGKAKEPVPWLKLAGCAPFWALVTAFCLNAFSYYNLLSWTPLYFNESFPNSKGWVFNVVPWLANFVFSVVQGHVADSLIKRSLSTTYVRKLFAAALFSGTFVFSLLLNSVTTFTQGLFVMSLNIGVLAMGTCSLSLNPTDLAPKHAGVLYGVLSACGALAGSVGISLTGYILETSGKWSSAFNVIAIASVIGGVVFQFYGSGERIV